MKNAHHTLLSCPHQMSLSFSTSRVVATRARQLLVGSGRERKIAYKKAMIVMARGYLYGLRVLAWPVLDHAVVGCLEMSGRLNSRVSAHAALNIS